MHLHITLHYIVNVLNATELFSFKGLILCYVNFMSIKKRKKKTSKNVTFGKVITNMPSYHIVLQLSVYVSTSLTGLCS